MFKGLFGGSKGSSNTSTSNIKSDKIGSAGKGKGNTRPTYPRSGASDHETNNQNGRGRKCPYNY